MLSFLACVQDFAIVSMLYENGIYQVYTLYFVHTCMRACHAKSTSRWMRA